MFHLNKKCFLTLITVILGAFVQAYVIKVFIQPANLLSSGFTGVAILIEKITSTYFHFSFSTSLGMIVLNVPVAILCYKSISPRFTFFSLLEVFLASFFLKIIHFPPIFDDTLLNVIFGGTLYGLMTASILKMNASTGGTDFVALYISNKKGKSIWSYVFIFNSIILFFFANLIHSFIKLVCIPFLLYSFNVKTSHIYPSTPLSTHCGMYFITCNPQVAIILLSIISIKKNISLFKCSSKYFFVTA